jgi:hypothetical protein
MALRAQTAESVSLVQIPSGSDLGLVWSKSASGDIRCTHILGLGQMWVNFSQIAQFVNL